MAKNGKRESADLAAGDLARLMLRQRGAAARVVHVSSLGGEWTVCGIPFAPDVLRVREADDATCPHCVDILLAVAEAADP